jgi:hypothetical protein
MFSSRSGTGVVGPGNSLPLCKPVIDGAVNFTTPLYFCRSAKAAPPENATAQTVNIKRLFLYSILDDLEILGCSSKLYKGKVELLRFSRSSSH